MNIDLAISRQHFANRPKLNRAKWHRLLKQVRIFSDKRFEAVLQGDFVHADRFNKLYRIYSNASEWFYEQWLTAVADWERKDPFPLRSKEEHSDE